MFKRREKTAAVGHDPGRGVRGGMSAAAIATGVVVAIGAMFLLSAIIGGILVWLDVEAQSLSSNEGLQAGIATGIAFVIAQFLSYLWGGYTAGRMGRGAGFANGILVPVVAILIGLLAAALVRVMGADANLNLPFQVNRLPLENDAVVNWGTGMGIAALAAMFIGGIVGGITGSRWHTKLERSAVIEPAVGQEGRPAVASRTGDDAHAATSHPVTATPAETRQEAQRSI